MFWTVWRLCYTLLVWKETTSKRKEKKSHLIPDPWRGIQSRIGGLFAIEMSYKLSSWEDFPLDVYLGQCRALGVSSIRAWKSMELTRTDLGLLVPVRRKQSGVHILLDIKCFKSWPVEQKHPEDVLSETLVGYEVKVRTSAGSYVSFWIFEMFHKGLSNENRPRLHCVPMLKRVQTCKLEPNPCQNKQTQKHTQPLWV